MKEKVSETHVVLGQINTTPNDFEGNFKKIIKGLDFAKARKADLIVFPECALGGLIAVQ